MADRPTLTLYGCPNSRSLRVAWALEEADADYAYHAVDLFRGEGREAPLLTLNPSGKVPVLVTEDGQISESGAILIWLAERYPRARLLPMRDDGSARKMPAMGFLHCDRTRATAVDGRQTSLRAAERPALPAGGADGMLGVRRRGEAPGRAARGARLHLRRTFQHRRHPGLPHTRLGALGADRARIPDTRHLPGHTPSAPRPETGTGT